MSNAPDILRPDIQLKLHDGPVTVHELPWLDAKEFLKRLSTHFSTLTNAYIQGKSDVSIEQLTDISTLIGNTTELADFLILKSTGKDQAWLDSRTLTEAAALLQASLETTLNDGLLDLLKKTAGRLAKTGVATPPKTTTPLPKLPISSSPRDTTPSTSSPATPSAS